MHIERYFASSPLCGIYAAYHQAVGAFQALLIEREGVHFVQALILTGIFLEGKPVRPVELAQSLSMAPSNLSHALRSLEKRACLTRSTLKHDARAYVFSLTPTGRRKALRLIKLFDSVQDKLEAKTERGLRGALSDFAEAYKAVEADL